LIDKGIEQGAHQKAVEMVKAMLNSEVSIDDVVKFSGLDSEKIRRLVV